MSNEADQQGVPAPAASARPVLTNLDDRVTTGRVHSDTIAQARMRQMTQTESAAYSPSLSDTRRSSWASSAGTSPSDRMNTNVDTVPLDYQIRYLSEHMSKVHPLQRNIWWRQDLKDNDLSPPELTSDSFNSSTSSNISNSPVSPQIPLIQVSTSSGATTPKASVPVPANISHPRGNSEAAQDRLPRPDTQNARTQSVGPPTKGVHFAEQPLIFQLDLPSSGATMVRTPQVTVMDRQWGELYDDKGPTQRMRRFLEAIAKVIMPPGAEDLSYKDLFKFYETFALEQEKLNYKEIFRLRDSEDAGDYATLLYHLSIDHKGYVAGTAPRMTVPGFVCWMYRNINAFPDEECKRLNKIIAKGMSASLDSDNGSKNRVPTQLARRMLPDAKTREADSLMGLFETKFPQFLVSPRSSPDVQTRSSTGKLPSIGSSPVVVQHDSASDRAPERRPSDYADYGRYALIPESSQGRRATMPDGFRHEFYESPPFPRGRFMSDGQAAERSHRYPSLAAYVPTTRYPPISSSGGPPYYVGTGYPRRNSDFGDKVATYARDSRDNSRRGSRTESRNGRRDRDEYGSARLDMRSLHALYLDPRWTRPLSYQRPSAYELWAAELRELERVEAACSRRRALINDGSWHFPPRGDTPLQEEDTPLYSPLQSPGTSEIWGQDYGVANASAEAERRRHRGRNRDRSR